MHNLPIPRLLTIAGSDCSGGAGLQADLKTFQAMGVYGMSVVTALTAQNTTSVKAVSPLTPSFVEDQLSAVFEDIGVDAVKIGMLHSAPIVRAVARTLRRYEPRNVVLDPVMFSKAGSVLLSSDAVAVLEEQLFPLVTLLTPNVPEAERLVGSKIMQKCDVELVATALLRKVPCVVIKGGHFPCSQLSSDYFASRTLGERWIDCRRVVTKNTHGTGCTYSAAIAASLGRGAQMDEAVLSARKFLQSAIVSGAKFRIGQGNGPVDHQVFWRG